MIEILVIHKFIDCKLNEIKNINEKYVVSEKRYKEMETNGIIPKYAKMVRKIETKQETIEKPFKKKKNLYLKEKDSQ